MRSAALILSLSVMVMVVNPFSEAAYYHGEKNIFTGIYDDGTERLVNGTSTTIQNYPHCAAMKLYDMLYQCGCSIIAPQYVLTAAHCTWPMIRDGVVEYITILTGTTNLDEGGQSHEVEKMWYHEKYNTNVTGRTNDDIGLIKLKKPLKYDSTCQPINLPKHPAKENEKVTIAAWGRKGKDEEVHNHLGKMEANVMLPKECQSHYSDNSEKISKNEICTLIGAGTGLCKGDSGSGLIRDNNQIKKREIVALVSGGKPCAVGKPDIYTNISPYLPWIKEKMAEK
ncbi:PREDICTED: chymotrypsin-1-like [Wasmannia auropunctata]|uniref:chymotrypsin-1-like n=1 Tax=Wasmannia auropunctata TaxID=64793 RepID=UPI0005EF4409|nr:PREDICTED: chymotrypsin-1-like [Wasmannia auropunctata]XP_011693195.1 PREDICTED: chymotrypsin-1-like [Wasmannia auropunctata]XP_011693196.1 PREDICTED: chymotrypsin-1-like [Wasmannia auropunctata]XP_011693197.1 PREDICTED: chymotrypsin-1-like [Wasmannia auropunctata]